TGFFQEMGKVECQFLNGTQQVRLLERYSYNGEQRVHFDSDVGLYVADTALGEADARYWNSQPERLEYARAAVDTFCRHNYEVLTPFITERKVPPQVEIYPMQLSSSHQTHKLFCAVMDFYPSEVEVK
ncbi:HB2J protein, partial [Galbula dea]|nr:HB2J protein [Galbula dea]